MPDTNPQDRPPVPVIQVPKSMRDRAADFLFAQAPAVVILVGVIYYGGAHVLPKLNKDTNEAFAQRHQESLATFKEVTGEANKSFNASRQESNQRYDQLLQWHVNKKPPNSPRGTHHPDVMEADAAADVPDDEVKAAESPE